MKKKNFMFMVLMCAGLSLTACGNTDVNQASEAAPANESNEEENKAEIDYDFAMKYDGIDTANISSSGVAVHDPSIIEDNGKYYIFGSHMSAAKSDDMTKWEMIANGYAKNNPVYGQIYEVSEEAFRYTGDKKSIIPTDDGKTHVWAPDVIYNKTTGKYNMYYCVTSTWNASNLCFGVADTIEGPYEWQGSMIYSGFNYSTLKETDVLDYVDEDFAKKNYIKGGGYNFEDYPNAIDPTVFYDEEDRLWMVYGSWSGGIFLLELDPETGYPIHPEADPEHNVDAYYGKKLLGGGHISIEGPYIVYDKESGYYYLFVSYGALTSNGGYQIRVFRSETVDGDYVDMNGKYPEKSALHQDFGLKMSGNYKLPSIDKAYMATGHNSAFIDKDGKRYIAYHTRFNDNGETHSPRVHQYLINEEGWPCNLPYQTQGESADENGYSVDDMTGRYFVLNQGTAIDNKIANPAIMYLEEDGKVTGKEEQGEWHYTEGNNYMKIKIGDKEYSGAFCKMLDEAGAEVIAFSAVGNNETLWGVKYLK